MTVARCYENTRSELPPLIRVSRRTSSTQGSWSAGGYGTVTAGASTAFVPGRYRNRPIARVISAIIPTADQRIETVLPRNFDSATRGVLRRIIRLVRQVMTEMVPSKPWIFGDIARLGHISGNKWLAKIGGPPCIV